MHSYSNNRLFCILLVTSQLYLPIIITYIHKLDGIIMDAELKKSIIRRYLEYKGMPEIRQVETVPFYSELGKALDALERSHGQFLDFTHLIQEEKWQKLSAVLTRGVNPSSLYN
jgi:hypothetical protein